MKKIFAIFMALALILCAAPLSGFVDTDWSDFAIKASAANYSGKCGDNVTWSLDTTTGVLIISGSGAMWDWYYPDECPSWYEYQSNIKSVTIGDSVTSIGSDAFRHCDNLTSVTIPDSVTSIGSSAFYNTALYNNNNNWENGVLYIGNHVIKAETSISGNYTIKSGTKAIAGSAFEGCSKLTSVTIPDSVTSIGDEAFDGCRSLTSVTIPDSVTSIGENAFNLCDSLTSVTIGNSVTSIGYSAFSHCYSLKDIYFKGNKCSVYSSSYTIPSQAVIHGVYNSGAYIYAMNYGRTFVFYCDHSLETSFEMPSGCVTYGFKLVTCKNCDYKANEVIEPLGHKDTNADGKCDVCQVALGSAGGAADITPATPTIKVDTARIKAGKQVRVDVSIKNNPGLASLRLRIAYNPALRLVSVKDGEILGTAVHTPDYNKNPYTLTWENDLVTENITADGVIATLTFDVAENTPEGDYSVTVSYDKTDSDILDKDMNPVDFATVNGAVKVVDYTVGDVNGDNSVNTGDRMIISRYIADWNGYEDMIANLQAADLNGDGKINAADRMILSRLIAGWSGYDKYSQ